MSQRAHIGLSGRSSDKALDVISSVPQYPSARGGACSETSNAQRALNSWRTRLLYGSGTNFARCMKPHVLIQSLKLACSIAEPVFQKLEQTLLISYESPEVIINGDSSRLAQAVFNLLHNASKLSAGGSTIKLVTRVVGETVQIED